MGCKTRRDIINLLREEPRFVSEISKVTDNDVDLLYNEIINEYELCQMVDIDIEKLK